MGYEDHNSGKKKMKDTTCLFGVKHMISKHCKGDGNKKLIGKHSLKYFMKYSTNFRPQKGMNREANQTIGVVK
jgi:hypothetical protein